MTTVVYPCAAPCTVINFKPTTGSIILAITAVAASSAIFEVVLIIPYVTSNTSNLSRSTSEYGSAIVQIATPGQTTE